MSKVQPQNSPAFNHAGCKQALRDAVRSQVAFLSRSRIDASEIMLDCGPAPIFGDACRTSIATVALNPSRREFENGNGELLRGDSRRLHTLESLGLKTWADATENHIDLIVHALSTYFDRRPYRTWFDPLDVLIRRTGHSYYSSLFPVCHIDLVPFATRAKWGELNIAAKRRLTALSRGSFLSMLQATPVRLLILNGVAVVRGLEDELGVRLAAQDVPEWNLARPNGAIIKGIAYRGQINVNHTGAGMRTVYVIGYNHNIQSSFGVTGAVRESIGWWIESVWRRREREEA